MVCSCGSDPLSCLYINDSSLRARRALTECDSQWDDGFAPSRGVQCLVAVHVLAAKLRRAHGERLSRCDEQSSLTTTSHKERPPNEASIKPTENNTTDSI